MLFPGFSVCGFSSFIIPDVYERLDSKKLSFKAAANKLLAQTGETMTPKEIISLAVDEGCVIPILN